MYKIALINMPFADLSLPSIALTQLKAVVEERFKDQVSVDVYYLNHDFARYLGLELYESITSSADSQNAGLGDWRPRGAIGIWVDNGTVAVRSVTVQQLVPPVSPPQ